MSRHFSCASGVPIFQALPPDAQEALGRAMHHHRFERGELVAAAGEPVNSLTVVASGRLKLTQTSRSGREQVLRTLEAGEFYGELALFTDARYEGDLVAMEETEACLISREAVQAILRAHHDVALRLVAALAQRLAGAEQLIGDLGLRDVGQRLAAELLRLSREGQGGSLRLAVPWAEMALRLGTTPESLSRRLKALAAQGLIRQEGARTVVILDAERLRRVAEE